MSKKAARMAEALGDWPVGSMAEDGINEMAVAVLVEQRIADELARLSVDESLSDVDRAKMFLQPGAHPLQQSCAITKLPQLFREHGKAAVLAVTPALATFLDQAQPAAQIACAEALQRAISEGPVASESVSLLLPLMLKILGQPRPDTVTEAWLSVLCAALPKLPPKIVREELLAFALAKGRVEEPPLARALCATLLGSIAAVGVLDTRDLQAALLKKTTALCQDTDASVRCAMCCQLGAVARGVRPEECAGGVVPELLELLEDEQATVRAAAAETLTGMLDGLPKDVRKQKGVPLFKGLCALTDPPLLPAFARLFGEMLWKLSGEVGEEELQAAADAYKTMARKPSDDTRQVCAWNLPGVAKVMSARRYALHVHPTLMHLAQDPCARVRKTIAAGLHEVMAVLGPERSAQYLREPYLLLLRDSSPDVLSALLPNLGVAMAHFAIANVTQRTAIYGAFVPALQQAMHTAGHAWRAHKAFMDAAASFHLYFSSAQIWEQFIPLCFQLLEVGAAPVRASAAAALASLMRHNKRAVQSADIAQRLVREFAEGGSASQRILFLDFCAACRKVASTRLFRDYFLHAAVDLLQDPVVCVRARACAFLPALKSAIRLPDDVAVLERLNMATSQRMNDADAAVSAAARAVADELKKVTVRCIGAMPTTGSVPAQLEADAVDLKREEEEWAALSKEEQDEKRRLDEAAARARADAQQPQPPAGAHGRAANGARAMGRAPSNSLSRSSSGEVASPVSKYAVQRSQGSLDQAAMVALSSAALGNLTVRTSAKERPGEKPGRGRAASADVQPGSPWPIAASAQRAPSSKPPLPTPPTRASSVSAAIPFPSSPPSASAVNSRLSASGPLPTSATASAPVSNGQSPTSPIARRSNSLPSAGQPPPNLGGSSSFHQSNGPSIAAGRLATGQSPGQTNSGGKASVSAGVSLSSPVAKTASTGSSKAGLAATASTSGGVAAGSPKAAKPAQPRFGFGSSSVKVTTTPISSSAAGAGGTAADASAKAGDGSSKIGSVAGLVKSGSIGADKVGVQGVKKPNPGIAPRTSVPASGRKPF